MSSKTNAGFILGLPALLLKGLLSELHKIFPAYFRWSADYRKSKLFQAQILPWCPVARFVNYLTVNLQVLTIVFGLCRLRYRISHCACAYLAADIEVPRREHRSAVDPTRGYCKVRLESFGVLRRCGGRDFKTVKYRSLVTRCVFRDAALVCCIRERCWGWIADHIMRIRSSF